jgi:hypothetical protein
MPSISYNICKFKKFVGGRPNRPYFILATYHTCRKPPFDGSHLPNAESRVPVMSIGGSQQRSGFIRESQLFGDVHRAHFFISQCMHTSRPARSEFVFVKTCSGWRTLICSETTGTASSGEIYMLTAYWTGYTAKGGELNFISLLSVHRNQFAFSS